MDKPINVFFCTCAKDPLRLAIASTVLLRWKIEPNIRLSVITPEIVGCDRRAFQGARRTYAEDNAKSEIYLCVDDDCMPIGKDFVKRGLRLMENYSHYGVMAARIIGENFPGWHDVEEVSTAGGINFHRAGILKKHLPRNGEFYDDSNMGQDLRAIGRPPGRARNLYTNHYGAYLGTLWPDDYASGVTQLADV